jgi:putative membrane protein
MKSSYLSIALLLIPAIAWAADNPDASFYKDAAEAGLAEVDAGMLAQEKSSNEKVKDFGAMMVKDHTAANDKLKALADSKGVRLPSSPGVAQQASAAKLKVLSGDTFEHAYVSNQVSGHEDVLKLLNKEVSSGQDADAKALAKSLIPTVRSHLRAARALAKSDGASAK